MIKSEALARYVTVIRFHVVNVTKCNHTSSETVTCTKHMEVYVTAVIVTFQQSSVV